MTKKLTKKQQNKKDAEDMLEAMIRMSNDPPMLCDFSKSIYSLAIATYALAITTSSLRDNKII
jgi:hypothetical protein